MCQDAAVMTEDTTENGLIREASEPLTINEATRGRQHTGVVYSFISY